MHRIKVLMHERGANLVVLCQPLPSARCSRFDLTRWKADRQVCNERIFGFPTSMRDHHSPVYILCQLHYFNGLRHCPYLIHLSSTKVQSKFTKESDIQSLTVQGEVCTINFSYCSLRPTMLVPFRSSNFPREYELNAIEFKSKGIDIQYCLFPPMVSIVIFKL